MSAPASLVEKISKRVETIDACSHCKTDFGNILRDTLDLIINLQKKDKDYGSSWKKRGGVGAFMMLARKWDRIENALRIPGVHELEDDTYKSIFEAAASDTRPEGLMDDIDDLISYLLLVKNEIKTRSPKRLLESATTTANIDFTNGSQPDGRYVFQD